MLLEPQAFFTFGTRNRSGGKPGFYPASHDPPPVWILSLHCSTIGGPRRRFTSIPAEPPNDCRTPDGNPRP